MRFFWFDWDDPKGSIVRGVILLFIGVGVVGVLWGIVSTVAPYSVFSDSFVQGLIGIMAFGSLIIFLGMLTLTLGVAAWLFGSTRHPRQ